MDDYLACGITAFSGENIQPEELVNYLRERYNLVIRTIGSEERGTRGFGSPRTSSSPERTWRRCWKASGS